MLKGVVVFLAFDQQRSTDVQVCVVLRPLRIDCSVMRMCLQG